MAEDFPDFNPDEKSTSVFPEFDPSQPSEARGSPASAESKEVQPEDVSAGMFLKGIPVLGAYVPQAEAAIRAAAHPLTGVGEKGDTYAERYAKNLPKREADYAKAERESPIASSALQMAGGAAALAPIGATALGARALGGVGTLGQRVLAGGASSAGISAADALARGEDATTAAGIGAGIGAALPVVGAAAGRIGRASRGYHGAPTADELAPVVDHNYATLRNSGVEFNPTSVNRAVTQIAANSDIHPDLTPKTLRLLTEAAERTAPLPPPVTPPPAAMSALTGVQRATPAAPAPRPGQTFDDLDTLRKRLGAVARDYTNPTEQLAAREAMGQIDNFIANVTPADVLRGNASQIAATATEARGNAAAEFRLRAMNAIRERAELKAGKNNSGVNIENAYRQELGNFIRPNNKGISPAMKEGFAPQEIYQIRRATTGTSFPNLLRIIGNMLGGGHGIAGAAGMAASWETGDPRYAMAVATGMGARHISNAMMRSRANRLARMTASRSPLAGVMGTGGPMGPPLIPSPAAQAGMIGAGANIGGSKPERREMKSVARGGIGLPSRTIPFPMYMRGGTIGRFAAGGGDPAGTFRDANGILTDSTGVAVDPVLSGAGSDQYVPPPPPAPPPAPTGGLGDYGVDPNDPSIHAAQVTGTIAASGDHYVTDSGQGLVGAPDANGMFTVPMNADGTFAGQPQGYGFGPGYTAASTYHHGANMDPQDWMGPASDDGRGAGPVSGAPPPGMLDYSGGDGMPGNWQNFSGRDSSTGGGFYTIADLYAARGQDVPGHFQAGSTLPSTNNYRMLPPMYRKPQYIMRNGIIIDMSSPEADPSYATELGGVYGGINNTGYPATHKVGLNGNWGNAGWPGSVGGGWTTPMPGTDG